MSKLLDSILTPHPGSTNEVSDTLRVLAWARVSTDMQEQRGLSMPEQLHQIREYAQKKGMAIVEEYQEAASAFKRDSARVEFHKMINRAKSDKSIDAILVHDYSRFSRDSLGARTLIRDLQQAGIRVISLNDMEVDSTSVAGVYMEAITFAKNEAYSREVAFHTRKGCRANVQARDPETGWCYKNGGQPLFGYQSVRLIRGEVKKGRDLIKSIWVPNSSVVLGKKVSEWARYLLVEMAAKGATLDELRDFCNNTGIPPQRNRFWSQSTWNSMLHPHCLLQYAGYGVWNVRSRNKRYNDPSEWVVVENAHEALITEDEVERIIAARKNRSHHITVKTSNRTVSSRYILSGGMFSCARCGGSMVGYYKTSEKQYYICNSIPNRRGFGCGQGIYVPQQQVEDEVFNGLERLLEVCTESKDFVKDINTELKRIWEQSSGYDPDANKKLLDIDTKIQNIRQSIEDGLADTVWANQRLRELTAEKQTLSSVAAVQQKVPQIDMQTAIAYRNNTKYAIEHGTNAEKKRILKAWVDKIELLPNSLEVEIRYKLPEQVVDRMGAGERFELTTSGL